MAPSDLVRGSASRRKSPSGRRPQLQRSSRAARARRSGTRFNRSFLTRFQARTRTAAFWTGSLIATMGFGLLFAHPLLAALCVCVLALLLLRPAIAMLIAGVLSAILTAANPAIFQDNPYPVLIQGPLLGLALLLMVFLIVRAGLRPRPITYVFFACIVAGGLLTLLTTSSVSTSLDALWKFAIPLAPVIFWFDNRDRSVCAAKTAPYVFAGVMFAVILCSLLALPSEAGKALNNRDFQGVFWHPQTLGMMMAASGPPILFARRLPLWLRVLALVAIGALVYFSWTRTAIGALLIGLVVAGLIVAGKKARLRLSPALKRPVQIGQAVLIVGLALGSLAFGAQMDMSGEAVAPKSDEILSEEAYSGARAFAIARAYRNFAAHPATGIGFGVPSDERLMDKEFEAQSLAAFRTGEGTGVLFDKGNSYLAIFEETGFLGAPIWLGLLVFLLVRAATTGLAAFTMALIFCLSLLAEATAFSLGGVGMVLWSALFVCAGLGQSRVRRRSQSQLGRSHVPVPSPQDQIRQA